MVKKRLTLKNLFQKSKKCKSSYEHHYHVFVMEFSQDAAEDMDEDSVDVADYLKYRALSRLTKDELDKVATTLHMDVIDLTDETEDMFNEVRRF